MIYIGSLLGAFIGYRLFGFLGLLIGLYLGYLVDTDIPPGEVPRGRSRRRKLSFQRQRELHEEFFFGVFSMLACLAKADGVITADEIKAVEDFMDRSLGLDPDQKKRAKDIFREAKSAGHSFEYYASRFYKSFKHQPAILGNLLLILSAFCLADDKLHPAEERLLKSAASIFGLSNYHFDFGQGPRGSAAGAEGYSSGQSATRSPYAILGIDKTASDAEVKKRYRQLALENHPDRITAQGQAPEFVRVAAARFREIQKAYEQIKEARGIK